MSFKSEIYEQLKERDGLFCGICGDLLVDEWNAWISWRNRASMYRNRKACNISIDHKYPKSKLKGTYWWDNLENLQLAHTDCNNRKADKILIGYAKD